MLIRIKTQIDYSLFGVTSRVYVGHDGWLFFRSVIDHQESQDEQLTDADLDQIIGNFAHLRDFLAARGIRLIVITNELKDHFYPEQLPAAAAFAKRRHRFDDFRARMHALPGIIYIDPTPILTTVQRQRPIFHKTDFHWNDPAAFEVAKILVDTIAAEEHRGVPFWRYQLAMETRDFSGTTAMFMPIFHAPHEQALFVKQNWLPCRWKSDEMSAHSNGSLAQSWIAMTYCRPPRCLGTLLLTG